MGIRVWAFFATVLSGFAAPVSARGQACCAGSNVLTPARLALHENALVGIEMRANDVVGSYTGDWKYRASPRGVSEWDFEQNLLGTVRVVSHGQVSLLMPWIETRRQAPGAVGFGGGLGDINLSGRYDFVLAGESLRTPGLALLGGLTMPTGKAPENATATLASDATGIGAWQGSIGVAVEQSFGDVLLNASVFVSQRASHEANGVHEMLGLQGTGLFAAGYTLNHEVALAALTSFTGERNAVINGQEQSSTGRWLTSFGLAGAWSFSDSWRVQGGLSYNPPLSFLGRNQLAGLVFSGTWLWTWS